jgi:hypothetical protein
MAKALGMVTVGEGVETPQQLGELHRLGCDLSQGYLLSRPVEAAEIDAMLTAGAPLGRPTGPRPESATDGRAPRAAPAATLAPAANRAPDATPRQPAGVASGAPPWRADR